MASSTTQRRDELEKLNDRNLRKILIQHNLPTSGSKKILLARIMKYETPNEYQTNNEFLNDIPMLTAAEIALMKIRLNPQFHNLFDELLVTKQKSANLEFIGNRGHHADLEILLSAVLINKNITRLVINNFIISLECGSLLGQIIITHGLQSLFIYRSNGHFDEINWVSDLSKALHHHTLQELSFHNCDIHEFQFEMIYEPLLSHAHLKFFRYIDQNTTYGNVIFMLRDLVMYNKSIKVLDLSYNRLQSDVKHIVDGLKNNKTITDLNLNGNMFNNDNLKELVYGALKKNKYIVSINLGNLLAIEDHIFETMINAFHKHHLQFLELGNLSYENIKYMSDIFRYNKTIHTLKFIINEDDSDGLLYLSNVLLVSNRYINTLDITINQENVDDGSISSLCSSINTYKSIESLTIRFNNEQFTSMTKSQDDIISLIKDNHIKELSLINFPLDDVVNNISKALILNKSLHSLKLNNCLKNNDRCCNIFNFLNYNNTIINLDLGYNNIEGDSSILSSVLKYNTSLATLSLNYTKLNNDIAKEIIEGLMYNGNMTMLSIKYNSIDMIYEERVRQLLNRNKENFATVHIYLYKELLNML